MRRRGWRLDGWLRSAAWSAIRGSGWPAPSSPSGACCQTATRSSTTSTATSRTSSDWAGCSTTPSSCRACSACTSGPPASWPTSACSGSFATATRSTPGPSRSGTCGARCTCPCRPARSSALLAALGGPDRQRDRREYEQAAEGHEAGRVIRLPEHDGCDAERAERAGDGLVDDVAGPPRRQPMQQKAGSSQEDSGEDEVEQTPLHFVGD